MKSYFATFELAPVRIGDIYRAHGVSAVNQILNKDVPITIIVQAEIPGYDTQSKSHSKLTNQIKTQIAIADDCKGIYTPSHVLKIRPYITIKFKAVGGPICKIKEGTTIVCNIVNMSPYLREMSTTDIEYLKAGSEYVQKKEFRELVKKINPSCVLLEDGIYGPHIEAAKMEVKITCGFRCVYVESKDSRNVVETLELAWNAHLRNYPGQTYGEKVTANNGLLTSAYLMLEEWPLERLLGDEEFLMRLIGEDK